LNLAFNVLVLRMFLWKSSRKWAGEFLYLLNFPRRNLQP